MKRLIALAVLTLAAVAANATVTVTGHVKFGNTGAPDPTQVKIRFSLQNCSVAGMNTPHVVGVADFVSSEFTLTPQADGSWSASVYGNDIITCDALGNTKWRISYIYKNNVTTYNDYCIPDGGTWVKEQNTPCSLAATAYTPGAVVINPPGNATQTIGGPLADPNGFVGNLTGNVFGNLTGSVVGGEVTANKDTANGYGGLDSGAKLKCAEAFALTGDVTNANCVVTLKNTGTPGTYPKVTTDAQGRVTAGTTLSSGDIPNNAANTSGTAATATALDHSPTKCTGALLGGGIDSAGNEQGCVAAELQANKNVANGYAGVDSGSRILKAQAPSTTAYTDQIDTFGSDVYFNSGRPWYDVLAGGASLTSASIQAKISTAGSNNTVYVPSGAYNISSGLSVSGLSNFTLVCSPGAILTASAGLGANPMLTLSGGASLSNVRVLGCVWNANSIATNCISINANAAGGPTTVEVAYNKCSNATVTGIATSNTSPLSTTLDFADLKIHDNIVLNSGAQGIQVVGALAPSVKDNTVDGTVDGDGINFQQSISPKASGNTVKNFRTVTSGGNGVECTFCTSPSFSGNTVWNVGATCSNAKNGLYFDTAMGGSISGANTVIGGCRGIRAEKPRGVTISGNSVQDVADNGIFVNHPIDYQQKQALDVTTGMTAGANVTLTADAVTKQQGAASLQAAVAGAFTTGNVWYYDFGSTQDWTSSSVNYPLYEFWFQTDTAMEAGVLSFAISAASDFSSPHTVLAMPRMVAGQWYRVQLYDPVRWFTKQKSVRTIGIIANSDPGTVTLHFDDFGIEAPGDNVVVTNNPLTRTGAPAIMMEGTLTNWQVTSNPILDAGYNSTLATTVNVITVQTDAATDVISYGEVAGNTVAYSTANLFSDGISARGIRLLAGGGGSIDNVKVVNNITAKNVTTPVLADSGVTNVSMMNNGMETTEGDTNRSTSLEVTSGLLTGGRASLYLQGPSVAANSFLRAWMGNARWDAASSLWKVKDQGSGANDIAGIYIDNNSGFKFVFIPSDAGGAKTVSDATLRAASKFEIGSAVNYSRNTLRASTDGTTTGQLILEDSDNTLVTYGQSVNMAGGSITIVDNNVGTIDNSHQAQVRYFRSTNTSGRTSVDVLKGDATSTINASISGNGDSYVSGSTGNFCVGAASCSIKFAVSGGNMGFISGKGQHFVNQAANSDAAGTVATAAATTASVTFTTAYTGTPVCTLTPQTTGLTSWFLSAISTTGFTVTVAPSGTYTFGYHCMGNPN